MISPKTFNGERLKSARIYRGKTISELAEMAHVTKQSISHYENGKANPSLETMMRLINALGFPRDYFYEIDKTDINIGTTFFRAQLSSNKKDRLSAEEKTKALSKIYHVLSDYVDFPKLNIPLLDNTKDIETITQELREYWGLGQEPVRNTIHLLEKNGFIVSSFNSDSNKIDAFNQKQIIDGKEFIFIILDDDKDSLVRRQFSSIHELGHIILHNWSIDLELMTKEEFKEMESEAHQFAASFLLPKEAFIKDLVYPGKLEFYIELKKKWRVSIAAMIMRAYQLEVLNYNQYQYLMRQVSKHGWRSNEPLDNILQVPKPTVLKKAIELLIENEVLSGDQLMQKLSSHNLSLPKREVEILLSLDEGSLNSPATNPVIISLKKDKKIL